MERGAREADKKAAEAAITNPLMSKLRKEEWKGGVTRMANSPLSGNAVAGRNGRGGREGGREGHSTTTKPFFRKLRDWAG